MFSVKSEKVLTRRGSKLLAEVIIGIIGLLGILIAQSAHDSHMKTGTNVSGEVVKVVQVPTKIDWLEILF
ncbi:hypothetical protein [Aliikangiella sp. G2MR2-5]|uniref:hypothetical protein n=1 Tax=Aliikangiella sp. G2MR2-5 TaxID=2788943 RepID=UPI0018A93477|nr:hypothetical protein [Aliikangiella sp. G2MR2-5]